MRGATGAQVDIPAKPDVPWLQLWQWQEACKLDAMLPAFKGLQADITTTPCWVKFGDSNVVCSSSSSLVVVVIVVVVVLVVVIKY